MHRLQDPARALRLAIRNYDEPKLARLTDWLLNGVPLQWDEQYPLARCRVIRGRVAPGDDGFAFALDKATGVVRVNVDPRYFRPTEVEQLLGDATKAKKLLGWVPEIPLHQLVTEMVTADLAGMEATAEFDKSKAKYADNANVRGMVANTYL